MYFTVFEIQDDILRKSEHFRYIINYIGMQKQIEGHTIFLKEKLGEGSFGKVYKGKHNDSGRMVAVKLIDRDSIDSDPYMKNALLAEVRIMKEVNSENTVHLYEVMESTHNYYVIQELCDGDLSGLLKRAPNHVLEEKHAVKLLTDICNGFLTMVRKGIIHRDLKPGNILLSEGKAKIGDFGFAKKNQAWDKKNHSQVGTPLYMSPQLLRGQPYTSKCDIWALGLMFYELIHGQTPWTGNSVYGLLKNTLNEPLKVKKDLSLETKDFISKTLKLQEADRISWDQIFRHPIFGHYFQNKIEKDEKLQNIYKKIMGQLRFIIKAENIDMEKLWRTLGYRKDHNLNQREFSQLIYILYPKMAKVQNHYLFQKMDRNKDKLISLEQIQSEFQAFNIPLRSPVNGLAYTKALEKSGITGEIEKKIVRCFDKMHFILSKKKLSPFDVFQVYDKDKNGKLDFEEFYKIMKKLDTNIGDDDVMSIFKLIDSNDSKTIEFDEFNFYYCRINGIPENLTVPQNYKHKNMKNFEVQL